MNKQVTEVLARPFLVLGLKRCVLCHCHPLLPGKMCTLSAWSNSPAHRIHKPKPAPGLSWGLPAAKGNVQAGWIAQVSPFDITLQAVESTLIHTQHQPILRPLDRPSLVHVVPKHRAVWGWAEALGGLKLSSALAQTPTKPQRQGQGLQQPGKACPEQRAGQQSHLCSSCSSLTGPGATLFTLLFISGLRAVRTEPRQLQLRELGLSRLEKRRLWGDLIEAFQYLKGT